MALADDWRDLAEDIAALADSHEARYKRFTRDHGEPSYEDSYDDWLRRAAYIEARAVELLAYEVHLARLSRRVSWKQLESSLQLNKETVRSRYKSFEKVNRRRLEINAWARSNLPARAPKKVRPDEREAPG